MTIKILSDSGCDLSNDILEKYDIEILPIILIKGDKEYLDNITISPEDVYKNMEKGEVYKTAQIPISMYVNKFEEYAKRGDRVIYVCFSSGLSGTYEASLSAKKYIMEKYPDFDLEIIDSKAACSGFGMMVYEAAKMVKEKKEKEEIVNMLLFYKKHMEHIFTVGDIEYLFRGGRVNRTQALVGGVLNIKPVLNIEDGKLVLIDKIRGKNKVLKTMLKIMEERCKDKDFKNKTIGISHGNDLELANKLKDMLEEKYGIERFLITIIGGSIGAHAGPGTLGITFLNKRYSK